MLKTLELGLRQRKVSTTTLGAKGESAVSFGRHLVLTLHRRGH